MDASAPGYDELVALVRELRDRVLLLERENASLRAENAELRLRLEAKPPAPPPPFAKPSAAPRRGAKKPGRPAGHAPALRPPPPDSHEEVIVPLATGGGGLLPLPALPG